MNKITTISLALLLLAVLIGATVYIQRSNDERQAADTDTTGGFVEVDAQAREAREDGNYEDAAEQFERAAAEATNDSDKRRSLIRAGVSNFLTDEPQLQAEGVAQLKTIAMNEASLQDRARAITDLASLVCGSGCDEQVFEMVFSGEPFAQYKVEGNMAQSVANLYRWALELHPTASAYVRLMSWHGERLILGHDTLPQSELDEHVNAILQYSEEADTILFDENPKTRTLVSYYFWKGYSFGGVTLVDPSYADEFERAYQNAMAYGEKAKPGSNTADSVVFAYYQYAALLHELYGADRSGDIRENIDRLATLVNNDPDPSENQFLLMVQNELKDEGLQHGFVGGSIYTLAAHYEAFNQLLKQHNLEIDQ